jgi:hypothetical protein
MNNKKLLVGGLAVVGAIALLMYLKPKPKKNSEGFFGADGKKGLTSRARVRCRRPNGTYYQMPEGATGCDFRSDVVVGI